MKTMLRRLWLGFTRWLHRPHCAKCGAPAWAACAACYYAAELPEPDEASSRLIDPDFCGDKGACDDCITDDGGGAAGDDDEQLRDAGGPAATG